LKILETAMNYLQICIFSLALRNLAALPSGTVFNRVQLIVQLMESVSLCLHMAKVGHFELWQYAN